MSHVETIALVTVGTVLLLVQLLRGPHPDPKLAAEPLSVLLRNVAAWFGYCFLLSVVAEVLPRELALPAILVITVVALVATAWWHRRHSVSRHAAGPRDGREVAAPIVPPPAGEAAISTADWVGGLVTVVIIGGIVLVAVGIASAVAAPS